VNQTDIAKANAQMAARRLRNEFALGRRSRSPPVGPMGVKGGLAYSPAFLDALAAETRNAPAPLAHTAALYADQHQKRARGDEYRARHVAEDRRLAGTGATIGSKILPLFH
jgi:hypothetical protein